MTSNKRVWVELAPGEFRIIRIFKSRYQASLVADYARIVQTTYATAVGAIRHQLWLRCKGECEICASVVTETSGHMHEKWKHRGQGGEISLENSLFVCPRSHKYEHRKRNTRFMKKRLTSLPDSGTVKHATEEDTKQGLTGLTSDSR